MVLEVKPKTEPNEVIQVSVKPDIKRRYNALNERADRLGIELGIRPEMTKAITNLIKEGETKLNEYETQNRTDLNGTTALNGSR